MIDANNTLTATHTSGFPSATIRDLGDPNAPSGTYQTPCLLAGTYNLRTSIYGGTTTATISSNLNTAGTFNVNWNSVSNSKSVLARSELGAAIAHMIDVPAFDASFFGFLAAPMCVQAAPAQGLSCLDQASLDQAICQFGNHPWLNIVGCFTGATGHGVTGTTYRIQTSTIVAGTSWWQTAGSLIGVPGGYASHDDIRAACDDILSMNSSYVITPSGSTCNDVANAAAGATDPGAYAHIVPNGNIVDYVRTSTGRKQFGTAIADTLNFLFGTPQNRGGGTVCWGACPNAAPRYYTITQVTPIVFQDAANPDAWQLYTAGYGFDTVPDQFFLNRNSVLSGGVCGGVAAVKPGDYEMWCDPEFDTYSNGGEFSVPLKLSGTEFQRAAKYSVLHGIDVPVFSFVDTFAENNGWNFQQCTGTGCVNTQSSIVNTLGFGTIAGTSYFSLLNFRQVPGYNPCTVPSAPSNCGNFWPGGGPSGTPGLLRRGFSQDTTDISPFTYNTAWEADIAFTVFDSMLELNPATGGGSSQFIDWGTTSHTSTYDSAADVTTQIWHLRNDWKFQDGNTVGADDVAYTILAMRDVPAVNLQGAVVTVINANCLDCSGSNPAKRTLQVQLAHQSALYEGNIGGLPILEKSLWAPYCGDPPVTGGTCANPAFDPTNPTNAASFNNALGILVGTGPYACIVPTVAGSGQTNAGHVGGPCGETASGALTGQAMTLDARVLLTQNTFGNHCCVGSTTSELYKVGYADRPHSGKVDFFDLASVAAVVGKPDSYWCDPNIACLGGTVGLFNLALVNNLQDHGTLANWHSETNTAIVSLDQQIDPFRCPSTGC